MAFALPPSVCSTSCRLFNLLPSALAQVLWQRGLEVTFFTSAVAALTFLLGLYALHCWRLRRFAPRADLRAAGRALAARFLSACRRLLPACCTRSASSGGSTGAGGSGNGTDAASVGGTVSSSSSSAARLCFMRVRSFFSSRSGWQGGRPSHSATSLGSLPGGQAGPGTPPASDRGLRRGASSSGNGLEVARSSSLRLSLTGLALGEAGKGWERRTPPGTSCGTAVLCIALLCAHRRRGC